MSDLFEDLEPQDPATITLPADTNPQEPIDEQADSPYEFATGNLDGFMDEFAQPKEDMGNELLPSPEEIAEAGKQTVPPATARKTGKFLAGMIDVGCATGLSFISGQSMKEHQADDESKKELESIITEYIKETGGEIPIYMQLIICLIVTYGLQIPGAIKMRKENNGRKNS